jgi:FlaA1/EpsC-like NDP-sugar epimerase
MVDSKQQQNETPSEIPDFYAKQTVLVTGATGFLGKVT